MVASSSSSSCSHCYCWDPKRSQSTFGSYANGYIKFAYWLKAPKNNLKKKPEPTSMKSIGKNTILGNTTRDGSSVRHFLNPSKISKRPSTTQKPQFKTLPIPCWIKSLSSDPH